MQPDRLQQLSAALRRIDSHFGDLVVDDMTELRTLAAPFLSAYRIYHVEHLGPHKPVVFYAGFSPGGRAFLLTGDPREFQKMARADGVALLTPEAAAEYAALYLEATRSMSELFYVVRSVDEVMIRPNLEESGVVAAAAFLERYRGVVVAPTAVAAGGGYRVTAYAIRDQALERHLLVVDRNGGLSAEVTILEEELPLVYGL